ncbi:MAG: ribonuclease P protein component [Oscillospiraceae bacterium]|nr:ribonuclease P protein component [Oscillospiraceae bacterium]
MNVRCTLKKNSDFRRLYSRGKSSVNPYMAVYCRRNRGGANRLGYTVSTKLGHAVVRNRVRRRLREIYRLNSPRLRAGWDIVVVARARCVGAEYAKIDAAFLSACAALGLMREEKP